MSGTILCLQGGPKSEPIFFTLMVLITLNMQ